MMTVARLMQACLLLLLLSAAWAGTVRENQTFRSQALGGEGRYSIYLPEGYERDQRAYPVIYLLHGGTGENSDWIRYGNAAAITDRLIAENAIPPVILVMPDGGDSYFINSPNVGRYENAMLELVKHVDATYRTVPERASRAVAGLSMGGYGSARFAIKYPEMFAAAVIMSGAIREAATVPEEPSATVRRAFGDPVDPGLWRVNNPYTLLERWNEETEKPAFYLTVGDEDEVTPHLLSVDFHQALLAAGAEAELRITDGGHAWGVWEEALDDGLLFIVEVFRSFY